MESEGPIMPSRESGAPKETAIAEDEFNAGIHPHLRVVLAVAKGVLDSEDLAWDAVQEALVAFWKEGGRASDARAWLSRAVLNRSLHLLRTRRRCLRHERLACADCERLPPEPSTALEVEETRLLVLRAIGRLPPEHRSVVTLRDIEGLDYRVVAERLGVPIGTVRSRLNRARKALREDLVRRAYSGPNGEAPASTGSNHRSTRRRK
jgi:RNA polymerase sigma-70 factor (ECF subfamily)